jgi:hypothetical protein
LDRLVAAFLQPCACDEATVRQRCEFGPEAMALALLTAERRRLAHRPASRPAPAAARLRTAQTA